MENFRQFRGTTKVDFSCDPEKNVTIILGDNTFGKTTLLQAFNWCFYGKVNFDQRPDFLLNYELAEEMRNGEQQKAFNGASQINSISFYQYFCMKIVSLVYNIYNSDII